MGSDGRIGTGQIREAGGSVVAQDQATSVVWGMPGAVAQAGHADEVLPLDQVAEAITRLLPTVRPSLTGARR
jgi:two-component system chemotaxis response regulator CheB